jgi:hypothetical protein
MINTFGMLFAKNIKGDFYWRLKYLMPRASRNPVDEIAPTAKHKRILPFSVLAEREHEHETLNFLAVYFFPLKYSSFLMGKGCFVLFRKCKNRFTLSVSLLQEFEL